MFKVPPGPLLSIVFCWRCGRNVEIRLQACFHRLAQLLPRAFAPRITFSEVPAVNPRVGRSPTTLRHANRSIGSVVGILPDGVCPRTPVVPVHGALHHDLLASGLGGYHDGGPGGGELVRHAVGLVGVCGCGVLNTSLSLPDDKVCSQTTECGREFGPVPCPAPSIILSTIIDNLLLLISPPRQPQDRLFSPVRFPPRQCSSRGSWSFCVPSIESGRAACSLPALLLWTLR